MFKKITRGGQINLHNINMFWQVFTKTIKFGFFLVFLTTFAWQIKEELPPNFTKQVKKIATAHFKVAVFGKNARQKVSNNASMRSQSIINSVYTKRFKSHLEYIIIEAAINSLIYFIIFSNLIFIYWWIKSNKIARKEILRGGKKVDEKSFIKALTDMEWESTPLKDKFKTIFKGEDFCSPFSIGHVPLVKNSETSHLMFTGTTGAGKTNAINSLINSIGKGKMVIVDTTGCYVEKFYRPCKDIILNPFDARSVTWSLWSECSIPYHYDRVASTLVPESNNHDKFWDNAAANIVSEALQKLKEMGQDNIESLRNILLKSSDAEYEEFFKGTMVADYTKRSGEQTTTRLKSTITNNMNFLRYLENSENAFSISEWISDDTITDQRVFIKCTTDSRETLKNYMTTLFDVAINATLSLSPSQERRIWFICDDLTSLGRVPALERGMAEFRKFGGCVVLGFQSITQLYKIYGEDTAKRILNLTNTKVVFRSTDPETNQYLSEIIGYQEVKERDENISFGANTMRDGVNVNVHKTNKQIVMPTEISNLKNLTAYLRYPGIDSTTEVKMDYYEFPKISESFIPKKNDKTTHLKRA